MHRRTVAARTTSLLLALAFFATTQLAVPVLSHPGSAAPAFSVAYRLEAETYSSVPATCDPDTTGQHTQVRDSGPAQVAAVPYHGCLIVFQDVWFPAEIEPLGFQVGMAPYTATVTMDVRVLVDLETVGRAVTTVSPSSTTQPLLPLTFSTTAPVLPGLHDIAVLYRVVSGDPATDLDLDHLDWVPVCNAAPELGAILGAGIQGHPVGWAGFSYPFTASAGDPEGDPITVTWSFPGGTATGTALTRSFAAVGTASYSVSVTDDPTPRCPPEDARTTTVTSWFEVIPDWSASLGIGPGTSCHAGQVLPSWSATDTLAGGCTFAVHADTHGWDGYHAELFLSRDATTVRTDPAPSFDYTYDSSSAPDGMRTLKACTRATGDPHARVFCSTPFSYLDTDCTNQAPSVIGLAGNAMDAQGTTGWTDTTYSLQTVVADPDGDPVAVHWEWDDGPVADANPMSRSFTTTGAFYADATITDDVSGRCPELFDRGASGRVGPFRVLDNVQVGLDDLAPGISCNDGAIVPSWQTNDVIARACPVSASVASGGDEVDIIDRLDLRVDGAVLATGTGHDLTVPYDSSVVANGAHVLDVCAWSSQDPQQRLFCSAGYAYVDVDCSNRGPTLTGFTGNGLLDGFRGWNGLPYAFAATDLTDPDGDPITARWTWSDGVVQDGTSVTRSVSGGPVSASVRFVDDIAARCPELFPIASTATTPSFAPVPDLSATLRDLRAGISCDNGAIVPSWRPENVIAARCTIVANAQLNGAPVEVLEGLRLRLDGVTDSEVPDTLATFAYDAAVVADGPHTLDICARAKDDVHGRLFCSPSYPYLDADCKQAPPLIAGFTTDGMASGRKGWIGPAYTFTATGILDPDGDPVTVQWTWSDGVTLTGPSVARNFSTPGERSVTVHAIDDTSVRCPYLPAATVVYTGPAFEAIPDMAPELLGLGPGMSCDVGGLRPSWATDDMIAVRCPIDAAVTDVGAPVDLIATMDLRVDGTVIASANDVPYVATEFVSATHGTGAHTLRACLTAKDDVHGRLLCSDPYAFTALDCSNVPPLIGSIVSDAMAGGTVAWRDRPYSFQLGVVSDPEDDPYTLTWTWSDGPTGTGTAYDRSFGATGTYSVQVRAVDDPTVRCPGAAPKSNPVRTLAVNIVPGWAVAFTLPGAGRSCIATLTAAAPGQPLIAGECPVRAVAALGSTAVASLVKGRILLDGRTIHVGLSSDIQTTYDSLEHPHGESELVACFEAIGDIHGLSYCSAPYRFLNVGSP